MDKNRDQERQDDLMGIESRTDMGSELRAVLGFKSEVGPSLESKVGLRWGSGSVGDGRHIKGKVLMHVHVDGVVTEA
ncbi:hypothetical protein EVAR_42822_1 [Eumeta japonica]|uniref:Uncharacterized protein n=1 Tax=Eumeta variegata TaxID=151549 RepID=A0A4C1WG62_EUMVA|nr:hypothetical protein EVAR_42822_1 [Eumeta japonica]